MIVAGGSFVLDYVLVLRPIRQSEWLHHYWLDAFMPRPIGFGSIVWLWDSFFRVFRTPGGFKVPFYTPALFVLGLIVLASSPRQKSRASMRRGIGPGSRRRDDAVLTEIRASLDNEEPGPMTQAATARAFATGC